MERPHIKWTGPAGEQETIELDRDQVSVGRLSDSDIVISNPYVSRRHASIQRRSNDFYIIDSGSTHGTFVNGVRVTERKLHHGDRISLGRDQVQIEFLTGAEPVSSLSGTLGDSELEKSVMQMTSVIPLAGAEASYLEKISHILNFQYHWEKSFSPESTFRQILDSSLKLSGAERGYILLKEDPGFKYVVGLNGFGEQLQEHEFRTSQTVVQQVVSSGIPVLMTHNLDKKFENQQSILAADTRAIACMPLKWISTDSEEAEVRGILYLDSTKAMHALTGLDQKILTKLADEAANVFEKLEMIQAFEDRKAYEKELALAQETQVTLLPSELPQVEGFQIAAYSQATRHVGGDFYDFLPRQDSALTGVLADVSGKGVSAALLSSLVQGALQMECRVGASLTETLDRVNVYLCEKSPANRFVTLFLFSLDSAGNGQFLSAGHNPAYLYHTASEVIEELAAQDLILGAFDFARYSATPVTLSSGDILVVYSDGVTEAMNPRDELFGEERLTTLIRENSASGCHDLKSAILHSIEEFTEGRDQTDDLTFVIVQKL